MHIIQHRINTIKDLENVDDTSGIEVDIRYHNSDLIVQHNPFGHQQQSVDKFEDLLVRYISKHKGTIILNVKTEGIEERCIDLMNKYHYTNWFFLDLSMPYFVTYSNKAFDQDIEGFTSANLAVRFSEFEPIEYVLAFRNKVEWIWVDCFTTMPLNRENYKILKDANFKLCLVAPELQKHSVEKTVEFQETLKKNNIQLDAVCTKNPALWR